MSARQERLRDLVSAAKEMVRKGELPSVAVVEVCRDIPEDRRETRKRQVTARVVVSPSFFKKSSSRSKAARKGMLGRDGRYDDVRSAQANDRKDT